VSRAIGVTPMGDLLPRGAGGGGTLAAADPRALLRWFFPD